jgi:hypothetical protein
MIVACQRVELGRQSCGPIQLFRELGIFALILIAGEHPLVLRAAIGLKA